MLIKCIPEDTKTQMFLKAPHFLCNIHGDLWRRWPVANDNVAKLLTFLLCFRFFFRIFMKFELRKKVGLDCIHFFYWVGMVWLGITCNIVSNLSVSLKVGYIANPWFTPLLLAVYHLSPFLFSNSSSRKFTTPQLSMHSTAPSLPCLEDSISVFKYRPYGL